MKTDNPPKGVTARRVSQILIFSPQGHVVSWNKGAERIKGYKVDEIIGKHFSCFYPPEAIAQGKPEQELRTAMGKDT